MEEKQGEGGAGTNRGPKNSCEKHSLEENLGLFLRQKAAILLAFPSSGKPGLSQVNPSRTQERPFPI